MGRRSAARRIVVVVVRGLYEDGGCHAGASAYTSPRGPFSVWSSVLLLRHNIQGVKDGCQGPRRSGLRVYSSRVLRDVGAVCYLFWLYYLEFHLTLVRLGQTEVTIHHLPLGFFLR